MKHLILILLIPFIFAGTWSETFIKTKFNGDTIYNFTRNPTGESIDVTFSNPPGVELIASRIARKKWNLEVDWSVLNRFDLGDEDGESKEVLWILVTSIRNNPSLTLTQATNWYNANYPNGLYNGTQLLLRMRRWIERETGYMPTWNQFKIYVQTHTFSEVDIYVP